jgi:hypothetical protein
LAAVATNVVKVGGVGSGSSVLFCGEELPQPNKVRPQQATSNSSFMYSPSVFVNGPLTIKQKENK